MPTVYHLSKYVIHLGVAKQAHLMLIGDVGKYRIEEEEEKKKSLPTKTQATSKTKSSLFEYCCSDEQPKRFMNTWFG